MLVVVNSNQPIKITETSIKLSKVPIPDHLESSMDTRPNRTRYVQDSRVNRYVYVAALLSPDPRLLRLRGIVSRSQTQPGFESDHARLAEGGKGPVLGPE